MPTLKSGKSARHALALSPPFFHGAKMVVAAKRSKEFGMAEDKVELRDINFRQVMPWTELFRGFQVALDPKKLLLAAGGILVMAIGWWVLSAFFYKSRSEPSWVSGDYIKDDPESWAKFKADRRKWNLLYEAAGDPNDVRYYGADDLAVILNQNADDYGKAKSDLLGERKPVGKMRTLPWFEDRGPNPILLVTGHTDAWGKGEFWDWLLRKEIPVLLEPLVKFFRPVVYLLNPDAGFWNSIYFLLVLLWTLATWAFFGGAITRMAAVQIARKEKIGMGEALRFTKSRLVSYFSAPLVPLAGVVVFVVLLILFGLVHMIPLLGDIVVDGIGWPLVLLAGLIMAVILVGLVGWPMMYATISAEGSDSFDALSRSYSYVLTNPWQYIWYSLVALGYGAVVVFFVGFMGSLMIYLGKWGVGLTPGAEYFKRQPEYLFIYSPTSFGWRELLIQGSTVVDPNGNPLPGNTLNWWNHMGAGMVAFWLYLAFLMIVGFGYSYFWSASTIIYLLMRRKVDDTDIDEVYLEEEESEEAYKATTPMPSGAPSASGGGGQPLTMVEPPSLKTSSPPSAPSGADEGHNPAESGH
jgi:hypothetical protein